MRRRRENSRGPLSPKADQLLMRAAAAPARNEAGDPRRKPDFGRGGPCECIYTRLGASGAGQDPSSLRRISLTALGLPLPPVSFITAPTKKPISFGLDL